MNISNDTSNKDMRDAFFDEIYLSSMDNKNIVVKKEFSIKKNLG